MRASQLLGAWNAWHAWAQDRKHRRGSMSAAQNYRDYQVWQGISQRLYSCDASAVEVLGASQMRLYD